MFATCCFAIANGYTLSLKTQFGKVSKIQSRRQLLRHVSVILLCVVVVAGTWCKAEDE